MIFIVKQTPFLTCDNLWSFDVKKCDN